MRVIWTNDNFTEAIIEGGHLWWKTQATVKLSNSFWRYVTDTDLFIVSTNISNFLDERQAKAKTAALLKKVWRRKSELPEMRLLKGTSK